MKTHTYHVINNNHGAYVTDDGDAWKTAQCDTERTALYTVRAKSEFNAIRSFARAHCVTIRYQRAGSGEITDPQLHTFCAEIASA